MTRQRSTLKSRAITAAAVAGLAVAVTLAVTLAVAVAAATIATGEGRDEPAKAPESVEPVPIVVELFTSQGCSSCPPADRLLSRWADSPDAEVIPLAFHVDYWNRLGWEDPFSAPEWSERQRRYARTLPGGRVYTPQLVVAGRGDCVGSNVTAVERELAAAQRRLAEEGGGSVELSGRLSPDRRQILVEVAASAPPGSRAQDLLLAVYENGLDTSVQRGENARRDLHNDFVVRRLARLAGVEGGEPAVEKSLELELDPEWQAERLGLVAFLQDPERLTISGAARLARVAGGA